MKQIDDDPNYKRIHMGWFKNRLRKGELQHKIKSIFTDDYLFDAQEKFQETHEFEDTPPDYFVSNSLDGPWTWASGDKNGEFNLTVNMNSHYIFRLKPTGNNQKNHAK